MAQTWGRWTQVGEMFRVERSFKKVPCQCACGVERNVYFHTLQAGGSKSCGCLQREIVSALSHVHGDSATPLNRAWRGMRERCTNPKRKEYHNYGGRGITVCPEWEWYENFRDWAYDNGYEHGLDLDRIDNEGNYEPSNCRFVTRKVNLRNTRRNRMLTAFGETKAMSAWAEDPRCVLPLKGFQGRIRLGWDTELALTAPSHTRSHPRSDKGKKRGSN